MNIYGHAAPHLPLVLLAALANSDIRMWMYGRDVLHGLLRLLHLLSLAGFLGPVLLLNLKQLGLFPRADFQPMRRPVLRVLEISFWLTIASGLALFVFDPLGAGLHTMFLPKLVLIVLGFVQAKWPRRTLRRRGFAGTSLVIWFLVMGCSTWNDIERPRNPADLYRMENRGHGTAD